MPRKTLEYRCPICQGETHGDDPWPTHLADCPDRPSTAAMWAQVKSGRSVDHICAELRAQAELRRVQAERLRTIARARARVAAGPPAPAHSKHTPYYVRDRQLELFQEAVDFLKSEEGYNSDPWESFGLS